MISPADDGWRVRSAHNPSQYYLVFTEQDALRCGCPDFETHFPEDGTWICKHVLAVQDYQAKLANRKPKADAEERVSVQPDTSSEVKSVAKEAKNAEPQNGSSVPAQMVIKRSLSPDGRIDSISIEFSSVVDETTVTQIKSRALKTLKLQTEIVESFIGSAKANGRGNGAARMNGAVASRMLDVGITQTAYGERVFLNFDVNGRRARLFGSERAILDAIAAAGKRIEADSIEPGLTLNLPCRVLTEQNGKYLNVTQVFASARGGSR